MRFDGVAQLSGVGCWSWLEGRVAWDETTRRLFDRQDSPVDYTAYLECIHPDDRAAVDSNIQRFVREGHYEDIEHRVILSDGRIRWLFARGAALFDATGEVQGLQGIVLDMTELKDREEQLALEAETDPLTRLRNRRWLQQEGPREAGRCERGAAPFSLAFLDLDNFKDVNDGPGGHKAGDHFLIEVANRLLVRLRLGDVLVRVGGDEFVVVLPRTTAQEGEVVRHRLAEAVAHEPIEGVRPSVSAGVATWSPGETFDAVLARADRAMYDEKQRRRTAARRD